MSNPYRRTMPKPILCLDFDGVIHSYTSGWQGACVISDPYVPGFFSWAIKAVQHFKLVVYSSRSKEPGAIKAMQEWLGTQTINAVLAGEVSNGFEWPILFDNLEFTHEKPKAFLTIDDRAVCFQGDWDSWRYDPEHLIHFKPWNK
jgi:hypothetical protein